MLSVMLVDLTGGGFVAARDAGGEERADGSPCSS